MIAFQIAVSVPGAAGPAIHLHEAHAAFDQPPGQETSVAELRRFFPFETVRLFYRVRFVRQIDGLRRGRLHSKRQFIGGLPGREPHIVGAIPPVHLVKDLD